MSCCDKTEQDKDKNSLAEVGDGPCQILLEPLQTTYQPHGLKYE